MILNYVDDNGEVVGFTFPEEETADGSGTIGSSIRTKIDELQKSYLAQLETCFSQSEGVSPSACVMEATRQLWAASAKFLSEAFFTRDNYCFQTYAKHKEQYEKKKKKSADSYLVDKFHGIMIHSPASCRSALKTRETDFNCYPKKKDKKIGTHFIIDGDDGNVFSLLPLDCLANHCGKPMKTEKEAYEGTHSLNGKMIAVDIGEPSGVLIMEIAQAKSFPKEYRDTYWKKIGGHYYGIAEKISAKEYKSLSKEEQAEWIKGSYTKKDEKKGTETVITEYFRSTPEFVQANREGVKKAYLAAAELAAGLCYCYGFNPLGKGKKLSFDIEKKKYSETKTNVYDVVIGHVEGYKNFFKASEHGDPENLWKMEGVGYSMDTFRQAVYEQLELLRKKEKPLHPLLGCLTRMWTEAPPDKEEVPEEKDTGDGKEKNPAGSSEENSTSGPLATALFKKIDKERFVKIFEDAGKAILSGKDSAGFYADTVGETDSEKAKAEVERYSRTLLNAKAIDLTGIVLDVLKLR